ncbi:MAG: topoisomerase DNA-binding C4 zinc finger domain-containing protein [Alphaproteobacteria bacterium]|nr:topoisomerase DNA-binding C4 zinc finger domain-containing protein [Alphaproteobacteria bacterium]
MNGKANLLPLRPVINALAKHPVLSAIVTFFILRIAGSPLILPTTCRDGSHSSSIGRQGACSWHGGIGTNWSALLVTIVSAAAAFALWSFLENKNEQKRKHDREMAKIRQAEMEKAIKEDADQKGVACPKCGFPLRTRIARRGRYKGKEFWGCSRYPSCDGMKPFADVKQVEP